MLCHRGDYPDEASKDSAGSDYGTNSRAAERGARNLGIRILRLFFQKALFPSDYSVEDLTWRCTPSDVATITSTGALSAKSEGMAEVSAQYKNSDGSVIYASIKVYVSETKLPTYSQSDINITYQGVNLLESESASSFVPSNMTSSFELKYYEIVETNGKITVIPKVASTPVTIEDLKIVKPENKLLVMLISDGKIMKENLQLAKLDENFLLRQIKKIGESNIKNILVFTIDNDGNMYIQPKNKPYVTLKTSFEGGDNW